jgi:hypothetical protein
MIGHRDLIYDEVFGEVCKDRETLSGSRVFFPAKDPEMGEVKRKGDTMSENRHLQRFSRRGKTFITKEREESCNEYEE